ncbi:hypothetical protein MNBD_GAMMA09-901 [hydrothermal vent metagenome]|uniref:Uncharacterized protein n=1 Tax=hydrothermal vent metagenome TaxID=652676 RepID=A0A3B0XRE8_9ZZZZ
MTKNTLKNLVLTTALVAASASFSANAELYNPNSPNLTIENTISEVDGAIGGFVDSNGNVNGDATNPDNVSILYPIAGLVYATVTDGTTGETLGAYKETGTISATALFDVSFFGLTGDWSLLPTTMPWTMMDDFRLNVNGSTFRFEEELTGRAFPQLGPVEDPAVTGTLALRMAGCAGVREISGAGRYANKVGTLCLNGTFTFDQDFNGKGVSNCTIAVHDPIQ